MGVLARHGISFDPVQERNRIGASLAGIDDLIDAAVGLLTASRVANGSVRVIGDGAIDLARAEDGNLCLRVHGCRIEQ
jgi:hypothetical protein